jgi:hypothetical protein
MVSIKLFGYVKSSSIGIIISFGYLYKVGINFFHTLVLCFNQVILILELLFKSYINSSGRSFSLFGNSSIAKFILIMSGCFVLAKIDYIT